MIELDKPYKLCFGMGATIEWEQLTGRKLQDLEDEVPFTDCAKLLWVMMKQETPTLKLTEVSKLVDEYAESMNYVIQTTMSAVRAAYTGKNAQTTEKGKK